MGQVTSRLMLPANLFNADNSRMSFGTAEAFNVGDEGIYQRNMNPTFCTHFLMGGELFSYGEKKKGTAEKRNDKTDVTKDSFLFGDSLDLDLLGNKAVKFPYYQSKGISDSVSALYALINIRRDSVKFVRVESARKSTLWNYRLEFTFDCDVPCYIQIHFCAKEVVDGDYAQIVPKYPTIESSEKFYYESGTGQVFNKYSFNRHESKLMHYNGGSYFPVVIEISTRTRPIQIQTTMCSIERSMDQSSALLLKPLKQKLIADGVVYLMQEIFGLENKEIDDSLHHFAIDECSGECIICMGNPRDTVILPCRHLCICNGCAETLRYKLNNCPICRSPFKALLKLRTVKSINNSGNFGGSGTGRIRHDTTTLIEALNGPYQSDNIASISSSEDNANTMKSLSSKSKDADDRTSHEHCELQDDAPSQSMRRVHSPSSSHLLSENDDYSLSYTKTGSDSASFGSPRHHATLVRVESRNCTNKNDIV